MKLSFSIPRRRATAGLGAVLAVFLLGATACTTPEGDTPAEKRAAIQDMRQQTLNKLYEVHPTARDRIDKSAGYGVFSNVGINVVLLSAGSGWGVVRDKADNEDVYMRMASGGVGLGLGVKDFRGIFVFETKDKVDWFVNKGWDASGQADLAAKTANRGGAWSGAVDIAPGVHLYQITERGLAAQATLQGTKFWKDESLN